MMTMMVMMTTTMTKIVIEISSIVRAAYQSRNSSPRRVQNLATLGFCTQAIGTNPAESDFVCADCFSAFGTT